MKIILGSYIVWILSKSLHSLVFNNSELVSKWNCKHSEGFSSKLENQYHISYNLPKKEKYYNLPNKLNYWALLEDSNDSK